MAFNTNRFYVGPFKSLKDMNSRLKEQLGTSLLTLRWRGHDVGEWPDRCPDPYVAFGYSRLEHCGELSWGGYVVDNPEHVLYSPEEFISIVAYNGG